MDYSFVAARAETLRGRIEAAARRSGRSLSDVELLAVTKFHPVEAAEAAWAAGIGSFGESRVQEAEAKFPAFRAARQGARLDMIGHLQANKAKRAALLFDRVQSVDSLELLENLDGQARKAGKRLEILLELHTGEESKEGFSDADELFRALDSYLSRDERSLEPRGLMTMAPLMASSGETAVRASFRTLRAALEGAQARFDLGRLDLLSMGMSGDFELAVEEGSTIVRVGTALFGERQAR
jgi:pyridoxal phosphate enzyme (YggS family)